MKSKKNIKYGFILIVLIALYIAFIVMTGLLGDKGKEPEITAPSSVLEVSVEDKEDVLLKGIKANDDEDGNISDKVFIESISAFDDNKQRTVTYAVFDSDDHLVRTTRQIKYSDYTVPVFDIDEALCYYYYLSSNEEYKNFVSAESCVDGDLSSKITVEKNYYKDNVHYVDYSVTDSCGTKESLTLKADELNKNPNVEITLKKYLKRVKKGTTITEIAPRSNMEEIKVMDMVDDTLKAEVEVTHNYNPDVPGTYEFIYRLSKSNGDYGYTKLVVIVEE